jgi:hypothetical protein
MYIINENKNFLFPNDEIFTSNLYVKTGVSSFNEKLRINSIFSKLISFLLLKNINLKCEVNK